MSVLASNLADCYLRGLAGKYTLEEYSFPKLQTGLNEVVVPYNSRRVLLYLSTTLMVPQRLLVRLPSGMLVTVREFEDNGFIHYCTQTTMHSPTMEYLSKDQLGNDIQGFGFVRT